MVFWRRKNEGFVWNEYVRTTILVRRDQRRQRVEDMREAAVEGVKQAGRNSLAMSLAGGRAAAGWVWRTVQFAALAAWDWITVMGAATGLWLADRLGPLMGSLGQAVGNLISSGLRQLQQPTATLLLVIVAAITALSASARYATSGLDDQSTLAIAISAGATLLLLASQAAKYDIAGKLGLDRIRLPSMSALTGTSGETAGQGAGQGSGQVAGLGAALGLAAALTVLIGTVTWLGPALMAAVMGTPEGEKVVAARASMVPSGGVVDGRAAAVNAVQLKVGGTTVRLSGVEAPEANQQCPGSRSCAQSAKAALQKLVQGKRVQCTTSGRAEDGVPSATCVIDSVDIAAQLVRAGQVFATTGLFSTYASAEREARNGRLGVWRMNTDRPAEYRAKAWEEAKRAAPDGCPIKGVVSGDTKTYITPWSQAYERTKVRSSKGERWFCSEREAREAGWKPTESL